MFNRKTIPSLFGWDVLIEEFESVFGKRRE
jgi:hypothetical protein